jgi:hypothetical protein
VIVSTFSDICLFAEHTFRVLDKELIQGAFVLGNPETEGLLLSSARRLVMFSLA